MKHNDIVRVSVAECRLRGNYLRCRFKDVDCTLDYDRAESQLRRYALLGQTECSWIGDAVFSNLGGSRYVLKAFRSSACSNRRVLDCQ